MKGGSTDDAGSAAIFSNGLQSGQHLPGGGGAEYLPAVCLKRNQRVGVGISGYTVSAAEQGHEAHGGGQAISGAH